MNKTVIVLVAAVAIGCAGAQKAPKSKVDDGRASDPLFKKTPKKEKVAFTRTAPKPMAPTIYRVSSVEELESLPIGTGVVLAFLARERCGIDCMVLWEFAYHQSKFFPVVWAYESELSPLVRRMIQNELSKHRHSKIKMACQVFKDGKPIHIGADIQVCTTKMYEHLKKALLLPAGYRKYRPEDQP